MRVPACVHRRGHGLGAVQGSDGAWSMHVAMRCAMLEGGRAWNRGNAFANQNR